MAAHDTAHAAAPDGAGAALDTTRCPLCGAANRCVMADPATRDAALARTLDCWCSRARIDPAQLARVPLDAQRRACLCPACAAGLPPDAAAPSAAA